MVKFQPVKRSRLYEGIIKQIQSLIVEDHLKPGDQLPPERELAEMLSVSRTSVREALRVLDYIGAVQVRPGEGTFVRELGKTNNLAPSSFLFLSEKTFLLELIEARRLIESAIVELAVERATVEDLKEIEDNLDRRAEQVKGGRGDLESDLNFHISLAESIRNQVLLNVMKNICELWRQSREKMGRSLNSAAKALSYHRFILGAIKRRDTNRAKQKMYEHLENMRKDIEAQKWSE